MYFKSNKGIIVCPTYIHGYAQPRPPGESITSIVAGLLTGFCREGAHKPGQEGVHGAQHFGVPAGHASRDAALQGLEVSEDGRRLKH